MKLLILLMTVACLQVSASGYGQSLTLSLINAPLEKAFKEIKKQTGYSFVYTRDQLKNASPVTLDVKNADIKDVLDLCFRNQFLSFIIEERYIIVQTKTTVTEPDHSQFPPINIAGRITNEKGAPVLGITVKVKGTDKATLTDGDGVFSLSKVEATDVLIITGAEIETQEIKIGGRNFISIQVTTKVGELDQVLVMAYGKTTKRLNTGNISKVTSDQISKQPVSNALATLQGRVPGLVSTQSSGVPGSSFKIQIRGRNSLTQGSEPLFIIDGVPFAPNNESINNLSSVLFTDIGVGLSPFNSINPGDIESIEILKDADATAIYGSRGANGVILITTKKGTVGKTKLSANIYHGFSKVTRTMDMLNTREYVEMRREAFSNDGLVPSSTSSSSAYAPEITVWDTTRYTDFKDLLLDNTANTFNAQVSLSGGTDNTRFMLSGTYLKETTVFPGDMSNNRIAANSNLNHTSRNTKFSLNLSTNYSHTRNNLFQGSLSGFINLPPNTPALYDSAGNLNWQDKGVSFINPLSYLLKKYSSQTGNLISNLQLTYRVAPGLSLTASAGYNYLDIDEKAITPIKAQDPASNNTGTLNISKGNYKSWIIEPNVEYTKKIGKGKINILVGTSFQQNIKEALSIEAAGYTSDDLLESLTAGTISSKRNTFTKYRYAAVFGRINYSWQEKYIINLSARRDGSSRFGPGKRSSNFGAIGTSWIFSKESYFKNWNFLSFGKLRSSYGITGNDQISDYQFLDTWTSIYNPYQGITAITPTDLFNPNYNWEKNKKFEAGLDLGFHKNSILLSTAYYFNKSDNQLINYNLSAQTGFLDVLRNFPAIIDNKGFEIELSVQTIKAKNLDWRSDFNISFPKNKLVSFEGIETSSYASTYVVDNPLNLIYQLHSLGVNPNTGVFEFEDYDKDSLIRTPSDYKVTGDLDLKFYGGLSNTFTYKNFQLDIFFEFRKQTGRNYLWSVYNSASAPGGRTNQPVAVLTRWQKPGDISDIQKFTATTTSQAYLQRNNIRTSSGVYSDASFIRLKTISFAFNLPSRWLKKLNAEQFRIYLQGQNVFTITKYKGSDPESQNLFATPPLKTFAAGIQITL